MMTILLLLFLRPDIRDCQKIKPGDSIRFNHRREIVLDNHDQNWQLITRRPGTLQQKIRSYESLGCFKVTR